MEITPKKILVPLVIGLLVWIIAFFVIGWTQISENPAIQALYLPMVILFGIGTFLLILIFFYWYLPYLGIDMQNEWILESLLFGIIVMLVQFILDIITFGFFIPIDLGVYFFGLFLGNPDGSTTIIMYPLIVVWTIIAGFITTKLRT
ncbi:MAG: hypothetical protein ACFFBD_04400 [Candidatus Hodarchaeota archaeon]